jgi:hypothetical protein
MQKICRANRDRCVSMFVLRKMAVKAPKAPYNGMSRGFVVPAHERYELVLVPKRLFGSEYRPVCNPGQLLEFFQILRVVYLFVYVRGGILRGWLENDSLEFPVLGYLNLRRKGCS